MYTSISGEALLLSPTTYSRPDASPVMPSGDARPVKLPAIVESGISSMTPAELWGYEVMLRPSRFATKSAGVVGVGGGVGTGVGAGVGVGFGVMVGIAVGVAVGAAVALGVEVGVAVGTGVAVGFAVGVGVPFGDGVAVGTGVAEAVGVALGVVTGVAVGAAVPLPRIGETGAPDEPLHPASPAIAGIVNANATRAKNRR